MKLTVKQKDEITKLFQSKLNSINSNIGKIYEFNILEVSDTGISYSYKIVCSKYLQNYDSSSFDKTIVNDLFLKLKIKSEKEIKRLTIDDVISEFNKSYLNDIASDVNDLKYNSALIKQIEEVLKNKSYQDVKSFLSNITLDYNKIEVDSREIVNGVISKLTEYHESGEFEQDCENRKHEQQDYISLDKHKCLIRYDLHYTDDESGYDHSDELMRALNSTDRVETVISSLLYDLNKYFNYETKVSYSYEKIEHMYGEDPEYQLLIELEFESPFSKEMIETVFIDEDIRLYLTVNTGYYENYYEDFEYEFVFNSIKVL